jgi:predicted transcriptional regulator
MRYSENRAAILEVFSRKLHAPGTPGEGDREAALGGGRGNWHTETMTIVLDIPDDLKARVDAIAARSNLSPSQVIADALEHGHSLEWQERFLERVAAGLSDADRNAFASDAEVASVVGKYRPS